MFDTIANVFDMFVEILKVRDNSGFPQSCIEDLLANLQFKIDFLTITISNYTNVTTGFV